MTASLNHMARTNILASHLATPHTHFGLAFSYNSQLKAPVAKQHHSGITVSDKTVLRTCETATGTNKLIEAFEEVKT